MYTTTRYNLFDALQFLDQSIKCKKEIIVFIINFIIRTYSFFPSSNVLTFCTAAGVWQKKKVM